MAISLQQCALDAEQSLERLATELAKAGADEQAVEAVTKMAAVARRVASAVGKTAETEADLPGSPPGDTPKNPPAPARAPNDVAGPSRPATMQSAAEDLRAEVQARAGTDPRQRRRAPIGRM